MTYQGPIIETEPGRGAAFIVYGLYILSIPSAALFAPLGLIVAYASRQHAMGLSLMHLDAQIRLFWIAFIWGALLAVGAGVSWALTIVLIGFPMLALIGVASFLLMLWFTIKSVIGLVALMERRAP